MPNTNIGKSFFMIPVTCLFLYAGICIAGTLFLLSGINYIQTYFFYGEANVYEIFLIGESFFPFWIWYVIGFVLITPELIKELAKG